MSDSEQKTMMAVLLVVGLTIGAGIGYFMAPVKETTVFETVQTQTTATTPEILDRLDGLTTLVYGAIGASLIAALAAIVSLMQVSRQYV